MAYIYMDESGDLSNIEVVWNTKFFNITFLYCYDKKILDNIIKKLNHWMLWKWIKVVWMFHACHEKESSILKALKLISQRDVFVMNLRIDKVKIGRKEDIHELYNQAVNELIRFVFSSRFIDKNEIIYFIASRRETNKALNERFLQFLKHKYQRENIVFQISTPLQEKWLQVVDIVSHAFFRKYEFNDTTEYDIIQGKVLIEEKI